MNVYYVWLPLSSNTSCYKFSLIAKLLTSCRGPFTATMCSDQNDESSFFSLVMAQAHIRYNREMWLAGSNVNGPSEISCLASRLGNKSPIEVQLAGSGHDKCRWDRGSGCCGALGREKRGQWNDLPNPSLIEGVAQGGSGVTPSSSPFQRAQEWGGAACRVGEVCWPRPVSLQHSIFCGWLWHERKPPSSLLLATGTTTGRGARDR